MNSSATHLAFPIARKALKNRILVPKYYDPDLGVAKRIASRKYRLVPLGDLLAPGDEGSRLGSWIRREWYGTGSIPYVRTSDLSHWRVRPEHKKGVSGEIYEKLKGIQDVRVNDILFVAHGTYLVGNVAIVTKGGERLLLQDHVFRLRLREDAPIDSFYLLAALSTAFVRRQVRARQFSADIIDKIGDRHVELLVPIAKKAKHIRAVSVSVQAVLDKQDGARAVLEELTRKGTGTLRERANARYGFAIPRRLVRNRILIPKYYDPALDAELRKAEKKDPCSWTTIGALEETRLLQISTGVEVGKMAYGTGEIPFVRTSDLAELEILRDTRHGVSEEVFNEHAAKAALASLDVLVVRDGTYLVGSSALVDESDLPALICGGIFRLRSLDQKELSAHALVAALNLPIVRRQMRARQFTRDVIDTLGDRIREVRIPHPKSAFWTKHMPRLIDAFSQKAIAKRSIEMTIAKIEPSVPRGLEGRPSWSMR